MRFSKTTSLVVIPALWLLSWQPPSGMQVAASVKESTDIAVVVNSSNPTDGLSTAELRQILLGERKFWKNKGLITIVLTETGTRERDEIIQAILHMDDAAFRKHWKDKLFRGEVISQPLTVPSGTLAADYVASNPRCLAFVVGKNVRSDLKVLPINGNLPGAVAYPFKGPDAKAR
jgi:hypothetical protein